MPYIHKRPINRYIVKCKKCSVESPRPNCNQFICRACRGLTYPKVFYKNRKIALQRDEYTCQCCGDKEHKLVVHHIDCDRFNNSVPNLITLCDQCHLALHGRHSKKELRNGNIYKLFPKEFEWGIFGKRWHK